MDSNDGSSSGMINALDTPVRTKLACVKKIPFEPKFWALLSGTTVETTFLYSQEKVFGCKYCVVCSFE
jgi:hypothetical protein